MPPRQVTLSGEEANAGVIRRRPDTFRYCQECGEHVLRSEWGDHAEHDKAARERFAVKEGLTVDAVANERDDIPTLDEWGSA